MTSPFDDRVALVTGGGRGIGRAVAVSLAAAGARVAVAAPAVSEVDAVAASIANRGGAALAVPVDLGRPAQVDLALRRVRRVLGEVEILINNAAVVAPLGPTPTIQPEEVLNSLLLNVPAPIQLAAAVVPSMLENGWGRIVNVSSAIAANPAAMIGGNIYATTKTALEAHTLNLAAELAGTGIVVNVFRSGSVDTAMQAWIRGQQADRIGAALHDRFVHAYQRGELISPEKSADELIALLPNSSSGQIWDVTQMRANRARASSQPYFQAGTVQVDGFAGRAGRCAVE